jgi:deoxyguanosine kinase
MLIAFEGLPAAGKTTTAALLAQRLGCPLVTETTQAHPFLDSVYQDDLRFDLEVELAFLLLHSSAWRRIDREALSVTDFSPVKDLLFADQMLGERADRTLFDQAYARLYEGFAAPDVVVYLRADPEFCLARARQRLNEDERRQFEVGMSLERLIAIHARYEDALTQLGDRTLVIELEPVIGGESDLTRSKQLVVEAALKTLHGAGVVSSAAPEQRLA